MAVQDAARTVAVVLIALAVTTLAFFIAGSILIALAVAVPVIIVAALVAGLLFGKAEITIRRDDGPH